MSKRRQAVQGGEQNSALPTNTAEIDHRAEWAPSAEDAAAFAELPEAGGEQNSAPPLPAPAAVRDEPNPDMTPPANLTCPDPLWECTADGLPKNTIQAPTAAIAEERYRAKFLVRRPKVAVKRVA